MSKRLLRELAELEANPSPAVTRLGVAEEDLHHWEAVLVGPENSPYAGGKWLVRIDIPKDYPQAPPTMNFITRICHPNIHFNSGEVCIDVLKTQWTPAWKIASALLAVQAMLSTPEPDSPLNIDAANLLRAGDMRGYNQLIEYYKGLYATGVA